MTPRKIQISIIITSIIGIVLIFLAHYILLYTEELKMAVDAILEAARLKYEGTLIGFLRNLNIWFISEDHLPCQLTSFSVEDYEGLMNLKESGQLMCLESYTGETLNDLQKSFQGRPKDFSEIEIVAVTILTCIAVSMISSLKRSKDKDYRRNELLQELEKCKENLAAKEEQIEIEKKKNKKVRFQIGELPDQDPDQSFRGVEFKNKPLKGKYDEDKGHFERCEGSTISYRQTRDFLEIAIPADEEKNEYTISTKASQRKHICNMIKDACRKAEKKIVCEFNACIGSKKQKEIRKNVIERVTKLSQTSDE